MPPTNIEHKYFLYSPLINQSIYEASKKCRAEKTESNLEYSLNYWTFQVQCAGCEIEYNI